MNDGRSSSQDLFLISSQANSSSRTGIGLEVDGAFDFVDVDNVEVWSPSGIQANQNTAFKFGHIDGLSLKTPKCFGIYTCLVWSDQTAVGQSFGSIVDPQFDGCAFGMNITFPLLQLSITGGYTRALQIPLILSSPTVRKRFAVTMAASAACAIGRP